MTIDNFSYASDEQLMALIKEDNKPAFTEIMDRHKNHVINFAYRMLMDKDLAEDIAQDIFVKIFNFANKYKGGKFTTFLFTLTNNACIDLIRKKKTEQSALSKKINLGHFNAAPDLHSETNDNPTVEKIIKSELSIHVQHAISTLDEKYRQVIIMYEYHDLQVTEIAEVMGHPADTIKSWLRRARLQLKDKLTPFLKDMQEEFA